MFLSLQKQQWGRNSLQQTCKNSRYLVLLYLRLLGLTLLILKLCFLALVVFSFCSKLLRQLQIEELNTDVCRTEPSSYKDVFIRCHILFFSLCLSFTP